MIISTVILGFLILLIWKILLMAHDRREYAKFERDRAMAKWDRVSVPITLINVYRYIKDEQLVSLRL